MLYNDLVVQGGGKTLEGERERKKKVITRNVDYGRARESASFSENSE